ncbi:MAG: TonB-dependent receptor, partial [Myxococcales bacterium]|nr:TonB-dependent receptor [Myxococcales bacterium]
VGVSLSAGLTDTQTEFYATGALGNYHNDMDHTYLRGDLFVRSLHLRAFWNRNVGDTGPWVRYGAGPDRLAALFNNNVVDVELEAPVQFETGPVAHTLNVGGGYRLKRFGFSYLAGGADEVYVENHFKAFLNEQISVGPFGAVASLRADLHPLIPLSQTISPRGSLLFRLFDKTSIRATAGSAYRAPNGLESYMDLNLPTPADGVFIADFGNRNLRPERITTFELGVHDESTFFHTADVVVYYNQVTNLIGLDDVTLAINPFDAGANGVGVGSTGWINLDPVYTGVGLEAEVELYPVDGLDVFANANVMQVNEAIGDQVAREGSASQLKLNGGFSYRTPYNTDVSMSAHYLSGQTWNLRQFDPDTLAIVPVASPIDSRLLVSARVAFRPLADQDFEIAGTVWNITELIKTVGDGDAGFLEHPEGQPVIGRAYATIAYRF